MQSFESPRCRRGVAILLLGSWGPILGCGAVAPDPKQDTTAISTGNPANDKLLNSAPDVQATILASTVGGACQGVAPFYMGIAKDRKAFWSIRCSGDQDYMVMLNPDAIGSGKIVECSLVKLAGVTCYHKLSDHPGRVPASKGN